MKSMQKANRRQKSAPKPRTLNQLRADERRLRAGCQIFAKTVERYVPEGWRSNALHSLICLTQNGHDFVRACAYAAILRSESFGKLKGDYWPFVDLHHGAFKRLTDPAIILRWESSNHPELVQAAAIERARETAAKDARAIEQAGAR